MTALQLKYRASALLSAYGVCCGWLYLPSLERWLDEVAKFSSGAAIAVATKGAVYYVLLRSMVDVVTVVHDWGRQRSGKYSFETDNDLLSDGRLAWGPSLLVWWVNLETIALGAIQFFLIWLFWRYVDAVPAGSTWSNLIGSTALLCGGLSAVYRNEPPPLFPLPYRWLGLRRYMSDDQDSKVRLAWQRSKTGD